VGAAVLIAVIAGSVLLEGDGSDFPFVLLMVGTPWLAGRVVQRYRKRAERLEELAEQLEEERSSARSWRSPRSVSGWRPSCTTLLGTL
jgi:hypothetical protein